MSNLLNYILQLGDNALINGQRLSEWCGHGPVLEQDIALTNIALDHIGQARSLLQYAAEVYNNLNAEEQNYVLNANLKNANGIATEDTLAYLRDAWDFKNVLLVEQPNEDWAYTVARSFFYDHFCVLNFQELVNSADKTLAAIAEKSLKEALYHRKWSSEWVIRLGDGTDLSKAKMQEAINERWVYTGEMFTPSEADTAMLAQGIAPNLQSLLPKWQEAVTAILEEATLNIPPADVWMQQGGKVGTHSEHLGYILTELQFMQRAYPGMEW